MARWVAHSEGALEVGIAAADLGACIWPGPRGPRNGPAVYQSEWLPLTGIDGGLVGAVLLRSSDDA